jgi:tetratricopeptide (TPR) repeat protein
MDNSIEEKVRNLKDWNEERARIKPVLEKAVESHNLARREAQWKNYEKAMEFYKESIESYKKTLDLNPKYYLKDILERIDSVIEEHLNNIFNLKTSGTRLKGQKGIKDFVEFIDNLKPEEKKYIDSYEAALVYMSIAEQYYEDKDLKGAYEFYKKITELKCNRSFINKEAYIRAGRILFSQKRFKEALISFVEVLAYDRKDLESISYLDKCLKELKIFEYRDNFLQVTPLAAKKLIMEVL